MRTTSRFIRSRWLAIMKEKLIGDQIWRFIKHKGDSWLRSSSHVRDNSDCFWKNTKSGVFRKKLKRMCVFACHGDYFHTCACSHLKLLVHLWAELLAQITFLRSNLRSFQTLTHVRVTVQLGLPFARAGVWGRHHLGDFGAGTHLSDYKQVGKKARCVKWTFLRRCIRKSFLKTELKGDVFNNANASYRL